MGTVLKLPKIVYFPRRIVVDSTNNKIDFEETVATELTATIAAGIYTIGEFRFQVETAMNAVGASNYVVTYVPSTNIFTITSNGSGGGGIFTLFFSTGTNVANSTGPLMGYAVSDLTGALFYAGVSAAPAAVTLNFTRYHEKPKFDMNGKQPIRIAVSGANEANFLRNDRLFTFTLNFVEQDDMQEWHDFAERSFLVGGQFDYFPDKDVTANHIPLIAQSGRFTPKDMNSVGLIGFWSFSLACRIVESLIKTPNGAATITYVQLTDRVNV